MYIYEKIFARLEELHMSQIELSRRQVLQLVQSVIGERKRSIHRQINW